jgi:hypothetical protein
VPWLVLAVITALPVILLPSTSSAGHSDNTDPAAALTMSERRKRVSASGE